MTALGLPAPKNKDGLDELSLKKRISERHAECQIFDGVTGYAYEVIVILTPQSRSKHVANFVAADLGRVTRFTQLPMGTQPGLAPEEVSEAEEIMRNDPRVQEAARQVGVEPENLYADGWSIGYDDRFPSSMRLQQCLVYARKSEHENLYAHPMDFYVVLDSNAKKVLSIDFPRHRGPSSNDEIPDGRPGPATMDIDEALGFAERKRIPPPMQSFDYLPDLMADDSSMPPLRKDLKPLHVVQPEGVSYTLRGNEVSWQKWNFHVGFHPRDGLVISTVTYNDAGEIRPLFYRMSVAEMVVPYGETIHPHPRKFAFDVGEYGMGTLSNSLELGCDCLGTISYMDGTYVGIEGKPVTIKQCICIHEEDAGIAWKHTDYRPGGKSRSARARKLVIQMICTIANYEYIYNYNFYTDGSVQLEVRLTGVLNLYLKHEGEKEANPYGVEVAPQVTAQVHQHLFSLRLDPMIDGVENTVMQSDIVQTQHQTGHADNHLGNGFGVKQSAIDKAGGYEWDRDAQRVWSIANTNRKHYASGKAVSYKIHTRDYTPLALRKDSMVGKRAEFATKSLWVTKFDEEQLYPSGKYVPQQRDTASDSLGNWARDGHKVDDEDLVVWLTFGVTHVPRPEDFPVMPVEHLSVWLKPANFFKMNPAHDLPALNDKQSRYAEIQQQSSCCSNTNGNGNSH